jgi:flagellar protein FlgJ
MDISASPSTWFDFGALSEMKAQAVRSESEAAGGAAEQFESMFIGLMLKEMRKTVSRSELLNSQAMDTYQEMFDQQVSLNMSKAGGIGLAKFMMQQGKRPVVPADLQNIDAAKVGFEITTADALLRRAGAVR